MHRCTLDVLLWGALERIEILVAYSVHIRSKFECYVRFYELEVQWCLFGYGLDQTGGLCCKVQDLDSSRQRDNFKNL